MSLLGADDVNPTPCDSVMNNTAEGERERGCANTSSFDKRTEGGVPYPQDLKGEIVVHSEKMCWLPVDQPLLLPGDSTCSARSPSPCSVAQLLASRLRRIGDQLEKGWTAGEMDGGFACAAAATPVKAGRSRWTSFLCAAVHLTVLVLAVARRHL